MTFSIAIGNVPDHWRISRLKDLTSKIGSGATPRGGSSTYLETRVEHALIRSQCVHDRQFDLDTISFISPEQAQGLRGVEVREGDLLLNITGDGVTFGRCCLAPKEALPAVVNQHVAIIRPNPAHLDPGFLLSFLVHPDTKPYIESFNAGGSRRAITKGHIENFEIPLPPIKEQRVISALLGALDDKIELNRRMSTTLEEMARALYRSWFVDFDPVHARALGQSPAHMDEETVALFPDSFGPDGLPKGWGREPLARHVRTTRGLSYKGKHLCGPGDSVPLHNLNSIYEGGGYKDEGAKYYNGDFKPRHEIRPGDLIVANTEQSFGLELIGHAALVPSWLGPSGIFSQHLYKVEIREGSPLSKEWLYLALSIAPLGAEIRGYSNGTTVNMLPADAFEIPETAIPPAAIVEKMNELVRPPLAQQERLREESRTLADLRDTLLPRLMSGELRVRESEKHVEEVL